MGRCQCISRRNSSFICSCHPEAQLHHDSHKRPGQEKILRHDQSLSFRPATSRLKMQSKPDYDCIYAQFKYLIILLNNLMEERNKENSMSGAVYARLVENEAELTSYLKYIRHRPQAPRVPLSLPKHSPQAREAARERKAAGEVRPYVEEYLRLVREATSLESYSGRKIIRRLIQYLEEFPTMGFLVDVVNSFGRERKKLCMAESAVMAQANDEMIPLFQKVIEKVEALKKETESKKLMELGQRIAHLQKMVEGTKKQALSQDSPLRTLEQERVDKYLIMEENISKAEKNYGKFSQNFHKNQEVFSNINRVYQQIARSHDANHPH